MGLDMFLSRKKYVGAEYEHRKVTGSISIKIGDKELPIDFNKVSYIDESVAYWRKQNAIHKWFVDKVQSGNDDCGYYYVSTEDLKELLDLCKEVKENPTKASELLPTTSGFFFGGTDYDEWYFEGINYTIKTIEGLLKQEDKYNSLGFWSEFEYHSSW